MSHSPEITTQEPATGKVLLLISWLWVGVPLGWGIWETLRTSMALFR